MNASELPLDLKKLIEGEKIDFTVKAKRDKPLKKSVGTIFLGIAMCAFMSLFVFRKNQHQHRCLFGRYIGIIPMIF